MFDTLNSSIEQIKAGKIRALGVTTASSSGVLPGHPDNLRIRAGIRWSGIGAPTATPAEIIARLNREINAGLADSKLRARFEDLGLTVLPQSPGAFEALIAEDAAKWAKVIKFAALQGAVTTAASN